MKKYNILDQDTIELEVDGETKKFDLLFTFDCKENGKTYIAFTDGTFDEDGDAVIIYASYFKDDENNTLYDVNSQMEIDMIDDVLDKIQNSLKDGEGE